MRGSSLSSPAVLETLRPFIVVVWNGRSNEDMPADVREVYYAAGSPPNHQNIRLFVLDSAGKVIRGFAPFPANDPTSLGFDQKRMGQYLKGQIDQSTVGLKLPQVAVKKTLTLPDIQGTTEPAGVRLFVSFEDNRMHHFRVPVVETVVLLEAERKALRLPAEARTIPAATLRRWLEQYYPPAVMDGMGGFEKITGTLQLQPAGADAQSRYAILRGDVQFVLDNESATGYQAKLEMVLRYDRTSPELQTVRGIMEADFPRQDRFGRTVETVRMTAAIESRPK